MKGIKTKKEEAAILIKSAPKQTKFKETIDYVNDIRVKKSTIDKTNFF